jgi:hypothetical protein
MFARVVMFVPIKTVSKPTTIIRGRLLRWQKGEFSGSHAELKEHEGAFFKRKKTLDQWTTKRVNGRCASR